MFDVQLVERCRRWVRECLGIRILTDRKERAMRHLEEAMELAQALGVAEGSALRIAERVWSRPIGTPGSEAAGSLFTLIVLCSEVGVDLEAELYNELERVENPDVMKLIRAKHTDKVFKGIGVPL